MEKRQLFMRDWTASGRLFRPIEQKISEVFGPFMANTHTESNMTSLMMTGIYNQSRKIIKDHVNADEHDAVILDGFGMTSVMNKLQRITRTQSSRAVERAYDRFRKGKDRLFF